MHVRPWREARPSRSPTAGRRWLTPCYSMAPRSVLSNNVVGPAVDKHRRLPRKHPRPALPQQGGKASERARVNFWGKRCRSFHDGSGLLAAATRVAAGPPAPFNFDDDGSASASDCVVALSPNHSAAIMTSEYVTISICTCLDMLPTSREAWHTESAACGHATRRRAFRRWRVRLTFPCKLFTR